VNIVLCKDLFHIPLLSPWSAKTRDSPESGITSNLIPSSEHVKIQTKTDSTYHSSNNGPVI